MCGFDRTGRKGAPRQRLGERKKRTYPAFPRTNPAGGAREPERFCKIRQFVHSGFYDHLVGDATAAYDPLQVQPLVAGGATGVAIVRDGSVATALFATGPDGIDCAGIRTDGRACSGVERDGRLMWAAVHEASRLTWHGRRLPATEGAKVASLLWKDGQRLEVAAPD